METTTRNAALAALFTLCTASCTTEIPNPDGEEAESDQPCPREGCETELPCAAETHCPEDDTCRDYFCDGREGFCRYTLPDVDGDGYLSIACGGDDCNDHSSGTYSGQGLVSDCYPDPSSCVRECAAEGWSPCQCSDYQSDEDQAPAGSCVDFCDPSGPLNLGPKDL